MSRRFFSTPSCHWQASFFVFVSSLKPKEYHSKSSSEICVQDVRYATLEKLCKLKLPDQTGLRSI